MDSAKVKNDLEHVISFSKKDLFGNIIIKELIENLTLYIYSLTKRLDHYTLNSFSCSKKEIQKIQRLLEVRNCTADDVISIVLDNENYIVFYKEKLEVLE